MDSTMPRTIGTSVTLRFCLRGCTPKANSPDVTAC
jgi:hypothetical protein